jgi:hypothetical protein
MSLTSCLFALKRSADVGELISLSVGCVSILSFDGDTRWDDNNDGRTEVCRCCPLLLAFGRSFSLSVRCVSILSFDGDTRWDDNNDGRTEVCRCFPLLLAFCRSCVESTYGSKIIVIYVKWIHHFILKKTCPSNVDFVVFYYSYVPIEKNGIQCEISGYELYCFQIGLRMKSYFRF